MELLVVILIIGILAAIAVPQYLKVMNKTKAIEALSMTKKIADLNKFFFLIHGRYTSHIEELDLDIYGSLATDGNNISWITTNKGFRYAASTGGDSLGTMIYNGRYAIIQRAADTLCIAYNDKYKKMCESLGKATLSADTGYNPTCWGTGVSCYFIEE